MTLAQSSPARERSVSIRFKGKKQAKILRMRAYCRIQTFSWHGDEGCKASMNKRSLVKRCFLATGMAPALETGVKDIVGETGCVS